MSDGSSVVRRSSFVVRRLCLAGLLLVVIVACQSPTTPTGRKKLTIAWVAKSLGNPVFDLGRSGALQKAKELTAAGAADVEVLLVGPVAADAIEQTRMMDDLVARGVDGIAVSCNDPTACIAPINRAIAAGIPVMTWDSDSPQSQRFTFLSIDNYVAGQMAADIFRKRARQQVVLATGADPDQHVEGLAAIEVGDRIGGDGQRRRRDPQEKQAEQCG